MDKIKAKIFSLFRKFRGLPWRHTKPERVIILDDASKKQVANDPSADNPHMKEFWSTSVSEMDSKAAPTHTKVPSTSVNNQTADHLAGSSSNSTGNSTEFTNHGLILWIQTRQQWVTSGKQSHMQSTEAGEPRLSWDATYDSLLGSDKPFPQAIPLSEMVDFLVDVWEQEGLYD